jgi:hypothetical protein
MRQRAASPGCCGRAPAATSLPMSSSLLLPNRHHQHPHHPSWPLVGRRRARCAAPRFSQSPSGDEQQQGTLLSLIARARAEL